MNVAEKLNSLSATDENEMYPIANVPIPLKQNDLPNQCMFEERFSASDEHLDTFKNFVYSAQTNSPTSDASKGTSYQ